jgi:hypothetical protein
MVFIAFCATARAFSISVPYKRLHKKLNNEKLVDHLKT